MSLPTLRPEPADALPAGPARFPLDLAEIRERLRTRQGPAFWRGIEELADDARFREFLATEYPRHASDWDESLDRGFSRRRFLELGMASMALAGMTACTRQPVEKIVPYVKQPEEIVPGVPLFFATAMTVGGFAQPLLAESHEGRPTKVEGNPEHPASLGGATAVAQASVLGLYDPDRLKVPTKLGILDTWPHLVAELQAAAKAQKQIEGAGLRILTETVTSPTLGAQMKALLAAFPKAKWHQWEAAGRDAVRAGARLAFGQRRRDPVRPRRRRRHRLPRLRLPRLRTRLRPQRQGLLGPAPPRGRVEGDVPLLRRRGLAVPDRDARRPPAPAPGERPRRLRAGARRRARPRRLRPALGARREGAEARRHGREGPEGRRRPLRRRRRRLRARRGPRRRPRDERGARQRREDRLPDRPGRGRAGRPARLPRAISSRT